MRYGWASSRKHSASALLAKAIDEAGGVRGRQREADKLLDRQAQLPRQAEIIETGETREIGELAAVIGRDIGAARTEFGHEGDQSCRQRAPFAVAHIFDDRQYAAGLQHAVRLGVKGRPVELSSGRGRQRVASGSGDRAPAPRYRRRR